MLNLQQNTPEWLDFRKGKIGASDAPVIMGESPWTTPYQLWQEKLGLRDRRSLSYAMSRGTALEPQVRDMMREELGVDFIPQVLVHPAHDWMIASMDGVTLDRKIGLEIKCPGVEDHAKALQCIVPQKYVAQVQHQHAVGGFDKLYYASYGMDGTFTHFEVPRDEGYIRELLRREKEFYDCVGNLESPELGERDYCVPTHTDFCDTARRWAEVKERLKAIELQEAGLRTELIAMANGVPTQGFGVRVSCYQRKGTVDYKKVPELKGVNLDSYRREPSTVWQIKPVD